MKNLFFSIIVILTLTQICYPQTFAHLEFEGGGFVTEVYRKDIGNTKMLFVRTDIGGVYSSVYDDKFEQWSAWTFLNTFATTMAGLHVQGFLANVDYYYVCCGTDYLSGADDEGLWRYDVSSQEWDSDPILEINYGGNVDHSKYGGECIVQDDSDVLYTGGRTHSSSTRSTIYRSTDDGNTWSDINPSESEEVVIGHVSTFCINPDNANEVWVGTDEGVWKGVYSEGAFEWTNKIEADPPDEDYYKLPYLSKTCRENIIRNGDYNNPVHRIIMTQDGQYIFVSMGYEIRRSTNYGATFTDDMTEGFYDIEPYREPYILSAVNLFDNDQYLLVSVIDYPTRITDDFTESNPNNIDWSDHIDCPIDENSATPKHSCSHWNHHISWSRTNFTLGESPDECYSSGPYNLYRSLDDDFETTDWVYMVVDVKGNYTEDMNFPVVYDVAFGYGDNVYAYVPIADLVEARFNKNKTPNVYGRISIDDYAREKFDPQIQEMCDTYISNTTRVLVCDEDKDIVYLVGGNIFVDGDDYTGAMLKSEDQGDEFEIIDPDGDINLGEGHCIIDGLITKDADELIVLVGGGSVIEQVGTDRGVYWSTDGGSSFSRSTGISSTAYVDELFGHQTNLVQDPNDPEIIYLYLEGGDAASHDEQLYKSTDEGHSWSIISTSFPGVEDYLNKGCLAAADDHGNTILYLAMWGNGESNSGFFKSTNQGVTWTAFGNWTSAEQVVVNGDVLYVFGDYNDDGYNKIWRSTNGGTNFTAITDDGYSFPSTSHLTIDPSDSDILWISTSGQGVFRYDHNGDNKIVDVIKTITPFSYSLEQNYPNPFNPISTINYSIAYDGIVNITVYDLLGREIKVLVNEYKTAGRYEVKFNKSNIASGVYYYRIEAGSFVSVKKMVLIK